MGDLNEFGSRLKYAMGKLSLGVRGGDFIKNCMCAGGLKPIVETPLANSFVQFNLSNPSWFKIQVERK